MTKSMSLTKRICTKKRKTSRIMREFSYLILLLFFVSCKNAKDSDSRIIAPPFHSKHNLWTGSKLKNNIQYVCGIEFDNKDSTNIDYKLTFLEDWRLKKELSGNAQFRNLKQLDSISIKWHEELYGTYCFIDTINELRILFSRNDSLAPILAKVQNKQFGIWKDTTMVMHQK